MRTPRRRTLVLAGLGLLPGTSLAQGMLDKVDLGASRMVEAEVDRGAIERLIAAAAGRPIDLADRSLNRLDLSELDLRGADLRWARLNAARLLRTLLAGANLALAWAIGADFTEADLRGADLFQAQLGRARLDRADLEGARIVANFDGASLVEARLVGVRGGADMRNQSMGLIRASLRGAGLERADLSRADLGRADLEFAKLRGARLDGANLRAAQLGGADLTGASLDGAELADADLAGAILVGTNGTPSGLERARNLDRAFRG